MSKSDLEFTERRSEAVIIAFELILEAATLDQAKILAKMALQLLEITK